MKNTVLSFLKSKTFWTIAILQVIAIEPFIPAIKDFLPEEMKYIGTVVLPVAIVWAKVVRDKGILELMSLDNKDEVKQEVKKKVKTVARKKVAEKVTEQVNKNNKKEEQGE